MSSELVNSSYRNLLNFVMWRWAVVQPLPQLINLRDRLQWCQLHSRPQRMMPSHLRSHLRSMYQFLMHLL